MNRKAEALEAARKSISIDESDAQGYILKSYAHQSMFDLEQASMMLQRALDIEPSNLTALLNLARIRFGSDLPDKAWNTLMRAESVDPGSGLVQNLKGFMLLARQKTDEAMEAFQKALATDSGLGEPHLGLALCRMRRAEPEKAMEEMSAAVLLEPRRSLILSYWAKMLYQLKRFRQALDMLDLAKELDPNDPTPHLYEGIIQRDLNRPVQAVESLHKAIALNDNRGVYRSRFLLDRDLAVKNVNLFIIYQQLGLSAWAQSKAVASIKQDYANYAGHLFYGSALLDTGIRTVAGGSELLLARILQPANLNAVNTFNSYTPFFEEPALDGLATAKAGNHKTRGGDMLVFGGVPKYNLAFNADTHRDSTDGWRGVNLDRNKGVATMLKYDPTPVDRISLSYRYLDQKQEDSSLGRNIYDQEPKPLDETNIKTDIVELGYHHHFFPGSDFLFFYNYVKNDGDFFESGRVPDIWGIGGLDLLSYSDSKFTKRFQQFQVQQTYKAKDHQLLAGVLRYSGRTGALNIMEDVFLFNGVTLASFLSSSEHDTADRLTGFYVRDIWQLHEDWILEGALYYDRMTRSNPWNGTQRDMNELNPRLGIVWSPTPSDTVRLAGFRYILPFTSNRIDPMEIGGVPIFRNTGEGSIAREVDLVWEHEWEKAFLSVGGFYLKRKSTSVFVDDTTGAEIETRYDGRLRGVETAYNQILGKGLALAAGYRLQKVRDSFMPHYDRKDHLAGVQLRFVHHSGFSAGVAQTYRYADFDSETMENEGMWITDLGMSYEFPGKKGLLDLQVRNVFNNRFNWVEDVFTFQGRAPAREIAGSLSIYF